MKISFSIMIFLIFPSYLSIDAKEPIWYAKLKQIKPLESRKADVERIFDNPKIHVSFLDSGIEFIHYETSDGKFEVKYSTEKCIVDNGKPVNIQKDTVVKIIFFPGNPIKFSKLGVNKNLFDEEKDMHDLSVHYTNSELGIKYVLQKKYINNIQIFPSENRNVKCE